MYDLTDRRAFRKSLISDRLGDPIHAKWRQVLAMPGVNSRDYRVAAYVIVTVGR